MWRLRMAADVGIVIVLAVGLAIAVGLSIFDIVRMVTHAAPVRTGAGLLVLLMVLSRLCYKALFKRLGSTGA